MRDLFAVLGARMLTKTTNLRLSDDTSASLHNILQLSGWVGDLQLPLRKPVSMQVAILKIAKRYLPTWGPKTNIVFVGEDDIALQARFRTKHNIPSVLCVGQFLSVRPGPPGSGRAKRLNVCWLEDDFVPQMSDANVQRFAQLNWEKCIKPSFAISVLRWLHIQ